MQEDLGSMLVELTAERLTQIHGIEQDAIYGFSLQSIASRNKTTVLDVEDVLRNAPEFKNSAPQRKKLALYRLDMATKAIMPDLVAGHTNAIHTYLKIQEREAKLTGMEAPEKRETSVDINISWLSSDRLAYKQSDLVGNVEDAVLTSSVALSTEHQDSSQAAPSATPSVLPDHRPTSAKRADEFLNQAWKAEPEDKGLAAIMRHPDKP